jgi:hypothetical protein
VTDITEAYASNPHNDVRNRMTRLRQLVSALMVLALLMVLNAPLLACQQAVHKCAMMDQVPKAPAPMAMAGHACCHGKSSEPAKGPAKKSCHETAALMPAERAESYNCCDMGRAPVVSVVAQSVPAKKVVLVVAADSPPEPFFIESTRAEW